MEPAIRALMVEFGDGIEWTFVMGGLAREYPPGAGQGEPGRPGLVQHWLDASAESGMPTDPRVWQEGPMGSTYPACMAVKAAAEQGPDAAYRYLRALREGIFCLRRKLDTTEALVEETRGAGLDVERFRVALGSHAIVEAFAADLEEARDVPDPVRRQGEVRCSRAVGEERVPFPTIRFEGEGEPGWTCGFRSHEQMRETAIAAGTEPSDGARPGVTEALRRFPRMAAVEVAAVCDLPPPRVEAELAQLQLDWRVRPVPVLAGRLWELVPSP